MNIRRESWFMNGAGLRTGRRCAGGRYQDSCTEAPFSGELYSLCLVKDTKCSFCVQSMRGIILGGSPVNEAVKPASAGSRRLRYDRREALAGDSGIGVSSDRPVGQNGAHLCPVTMSCFAEGQPEAGMMQGSVHRL
ncbi:MAG: hypothetical protein ACE5D1_09560 [Fidelibacterota bacterium]